MKIEIDNRSGFCFGVVNAIQKAEEELAKSKSLFCLGEIVHNSEEVERLKSIGLKTITHNDLDNLAGKNVLLRAHGEPPETYKKALEKGINLIDASCPVVLKLQVKVREGWIRMKEMGGQVVIFGKKGHAEVIGLLGQTKGEAIVVQTPDDTGSIDFSKPIELFSQTTMSPDKYKELANTIEQQLKETHGGEPFHFNVFNSICGQVANRKEELTEFSSQHDVILFVSGKKSSNGRMLFEVCKSVNPRTHFLSSADELDSSWLKSAESVGICGATSTPMWLMEEVAKEAGKYGEELG
ncbi:MAG TPA: 4-hydroxy-3-methylbut-2-enyl diphosphate reductase [Tenuifilaceae bacterium]|nr:4-hydroxy-3-methylbut-2-enyl diphosphate reductase [Tenuifilaceae bacterium]HPE19388.1 4-hydroxy-3-methylbut-2-enyl diphosphate reductase [Tenuifilaceae bacterium]HPJ46924.1 4-hydroxy-3-methylbut-2-enyl diphosphate reductase [Tenuifilaceae bacterium]HPQ35432.1 4-hydroxy-3-methylbut-2-enyl diphosphate reductase [Tenuifilaceae bacterium]HRX69222.1 4-hydroxy-3-methylbut-2-enyl diphosphate reductase [Tenuifilaceae bacterium]